MAQFNCYIPGYSTRCSFLGISSTIETHNSNIRAINQNRNIAIYSTVTTTAMQIGNCSAVYHNIGITLNIVVFRASTIYRVNRSCKISRSFKSVPIHIKRSIASDGDFYV